MRAVLTFNWEFFSRPKGLRLSCGAKLPNASYYSGFRRAEPLSVPLRGEHPFGEVKALFKLGYALFELIEFEETGVDLVQRLSVVGGIYKAHLPTTARTVWSNHAPHDLSNGYDDQDQADANCPLRNSEHLVLPPPFSFARTIVGQRGVREICHYAASAPAAC